MDIYFVTIPPPPSYTKYYTVYVVNSVCFFALTNIFIHAAISLVL